MGNGLKMKKAGGTEERMEAIQRILGDMSPIMESPTGIISWIPAIWLQAG